MKKTIIILSMVFLVAAVLHAGIRVESPNGGENWLKLNTYQIKWNSGGHGGNVKIRLFKGSNRLGNISNSTPNDGEFDWKIDKLTNGDDIAAGNDYAVRIVLLSDTSIKDASNGVFSISISTSQSRQIIKKPISIYELELKPDLSVVIETDTDDWRNKMSVFTFHVHNKGVAPAPGSHMEVYLFF